MPLYEYVCTVCGHRFEKIQSFRSEPLTECPKCKGLLHRPLTAPALQFKGAGWYVNDYAGKGHTGTSSSAKTDTGSTGSTESASSSTESKAPESASPAPSGTSAKKD